MHGTTVFRNRKYSWQNNIDKPPAKEKDYQPKYRLITFSFLMKRYSGKIHPHALRLDKSGKMCKIWTYGSDMLQLCYIYLLFITYCCVFMRNHFESWKPWLDYTAAGFHSSDVTARWLFRKEVLSMNLKRIFILFISLCLTMIFWCGSASAASYEGKVDGGSSSTITGWAWDTSAPDSPVDVTLSLIKVSDQVKR